MQIEKLLIPYKSRLRARSPGYLHALEQQVDDIFKKFQDNDFTKDAKLTAEFLLGYHCQRACFHAPKTVNVDTHELFDQSSTEEP
jgi:CRISPR-associated protein Csd1